MIFRQLTGTGDWLWGKGQYSYATGQAAIELDIRTRLQSWKGDCFYSLDDFVDWFSRLDKNQVANLNLELQQVILAAFGVIQINRFSGNLNAQTRRYTVTFNISTIYSQSVQNTIDLAVGLPQGS